MTTDWLALQNGSDIRGVAIEAEGFKANLREAEAYHIARGIVVWLREQKGLEKPLKIAIGQDSRVSGDALKKGLIDSFLEQGVTVIDTGLSTTPAMFMATQFEAFSADCGLMITASHLPFYYNGMKLFTRDGGAEHEDIAFVLSQCDRPTSISDSTQKGEIIKESILPDYAADLVEKIQAGSGMTQPLEGFHIVLDAGNGAGGFFAENVLQPLGAKTDGSQFLEPDGLFPNHIPNPDNAEAMASIQEAVLTHQADLGVIFDTDVDRAAVVDKSGRVINRNNLIAVLSKIVLEDSPEGTIVTNSPTSNHLKDFIESLGGKQVRYLCGYRNVINRAIELNNEGIETPLAIETSGHAAFKENYFLDDGAYVIAKILMLLPTLKKENKQLSDLIDELKQPQEVQEIRFPISSSDYHDYGEYVIASLHDFVANEPGFSLDGDNEEGIRVNVSQKYGSGWFLLRLSLHEPLLVLQVENDEIGKNRLVFQTLELFFKEQSKLDLTRLETYLKQ